LIIFAYDTETTGLDTLKDEIIEVGGVLYSLDNYRTLESLGKLVKDNTISLSEEIKDKTGITQKIIDTSGYDREDTLEHVVECMHTADIILTHNGKRFDKPITETWAKGKIDLPNKLWVDTFTDIPNVQGEKLVTMCANRGILIMEAHSALADAQACLRLFLSYNTDEIIKRAKMPDIIVIAHHARSENEKAKKLKFRWNPDNKVWWKSIKEEDIEVFAKTCPFDISIADKNLILE